MWSAAGGCERTEGNTSMVSLAALLKAWPHDPVTTHLYKPESAVLTVLMDKSEFTAPGTSVPSFCHWKVRFDPFARTPKVAVFPEQVITDTGCDVITVCSRTVIAAALLFMLPQDPVTTHWYIPAWVEFSGLILKASLLLPERMPSSARFTPSCF